MNEWCCIGLYTSLGSRFSGLEKNQGLLFLRTRWTDRYPTLASAHSAGRRASVQSSLLSHLMWCMIIQQMEATANYLLLLKKTNKQKTTTTLLLCCYGFVVFFYLLLSSLLLSFQPEIYISKMVHFVRMPLLCGGTLNSMHGSCVFNKNKNKTMKPLNAWFGIPFLKGYSVFRTMPPLQSQKPAASTRPVVSLSCGRRDLFLWLFLFCPMRFCLFRSERWPENCD